MSEPSRPDPPARPDEPVEAEIVAEPPTPAATPPAPDYDERGVPGFDHVRNKIEGRYATAIGATELAADTPEGRDLAEQAAERDRAARAKLEEIRRSLGR
jgi:hypothetical protein